MAVIQNEDSQLDEDCNAYNLSLIHIKMCIRDRPLADTGLTHTHITYYTLKNSLKFTISSKKQNSK